MRRFVARAGLLTLLLLSFVSAASIRNQVLLIEASETIRLESQKIVKNYLYFYNNPKKTEYKKRVLSGLENLDKQFRIIAKSTKDADSKDILAFLDYSKEKIFEVMSDPLNKDNPALMLDYSEILLEGAESISSNIDYMPSTEEKMLIRMKDINFQIERITKYYMAIIVGNEGINYQEMLNESIENMQKDISVLNQYEYSTKNQSYLAQLQTNWSVLKKFYIEYRESKIPNIVSLASSEVRKNAHVLELYHSKNQ